MGLIKWIDYLTGRTFRPTSEKKVCKRVGSEEISSGRERSGSGQSSNVVRIPRDWFGPKDELVPIGPGAEERFGNGPLDESGAALPTAETLAANVFWGEDAGAVHDVVDAPGQPQAVRRRRALLLVAAAAVVAIPVAGMVISRLGGSQRHALPPLIAALQHRPYVSPARQSSAKPGAKTVRGRPRVSARGRPSHRNAVAATTTRVAYHPNQARSSSSVSYAPSQASGPPVVQISPSRPAGPTTAASTASPPQSAQPAFGSSGALGPMSSPDG